jgi:sugar lactone lactonase YvrE
MTIRAAASPLLVLGLAATFSVLQPAVSLAQHVTTYADITPAYGTDLEFAADGTLYFSGGSGGLGKLYKLAPGGGSTSTFVSTGLFRPWGLAFDPGGTLYVADLGDVSIANAGRILKVSAAGVLTPFKTGLSAPCSIVFDPAGNLYVGLNSSRKVIRITPAGVQTDYATGVGVIGEQVFQLSLDAAGNLYAGVEQDMYKIGPGGSPVTKVIAGGLHEAVGHVRWDGDNFIVANYGFHQLLHYSPGTGLTLLTGSGSGSCANGDMPAVNVFQPTSMRLWHDKVYFSDAGCHSIRVFDVDKITAAPQRTWGEIKLRYR